MDRNELPFDEMLKTVEPCLIDGIRHHGAMAMTEGPQWTDESNSIITRLIEINRQKTIEYLVNAYETAKKNDARYGAIHLVSFFAREHDECEQTIERLIGLGISSHDAKIEEMACGIAESVRSKGALEHLLKYRERLENENRPWMLEYVDKVIAELKEEI